MFQKIKPSGIRSSLHTSPWIIIGSVGILLVVVVVLATQNYSREKKYASRILSEKGVALIRAIEAGTRTSMMDMRWGKEHLQRLFEETAQLPDVFFLTLLNKDGVILAHSDNSRIGSRLDQHLSMTKLNSTSDPSWQLIDIDGFGRLFLVYSYFKPTSEMSREAIVQKQKNMTQDEILRFHSDNNDKGHIVLVALNPRPFEDARQEDIRNTVIISVVLIILGFAGFISMFWMHNYRSTKRALQDSTTFSYEVTKSLPVGLIATDKDGHIAFYNSAAEHITGIKSSQALGKDPEDILPYDICGLKEQLNRGDIIFEEEMECEFTQGKIIPLSVSASEITNNEGQFVAQVLILRELGEVRRLQAEIRRTEKMAAIGGLAAGVAHEIRNPLSSIKGIASYYKSKFLNGTEDNEMAGVMIEEVDRLSRVITELLEFARPPKLNLKLSNLNELLEHSIRLIQQEATSKNIQITLNPTQEAIVANVDPDKMIQCFLNLYLNALQAMENTGQMTVDSSIKNDGSVTIDIKDTGSGIYSQDLSKIFDPYFTTKTNGTGLGLAIVHKIIEAHQGLVKVRSTPGQGCVFSIILPLKITA